MIIKFRKYKKVNESTYDLTSKLIDYLDDDFILLSVKHTSL